MKNKPRSLVNVLVSVAIVGVGLSRLALAHGEGEETVKPVMSQVIPRDTGNLVRMATIHYGPGQISKPHEHPGAIFAHVLEGAVTSQLEGQTPRTYHKGESWYEPPLAHHIVSRNASESDPATLLVFGVGKETDPLKRPIGGER